MTIYTSHRGGKIAATLSVLSSPQRNCSKFMNEIDLDNLCFYAQLKHLPSMNLKYETVVSMKMLSHAGPIISVDKGTLLLYKVFAVYEH